MLPNGGFEASLYIPKEAWLTAVECLGAIWRRLILNGVEAEDGSVTILEVPGSSGDNTVMRARTPGRGFDTSD